MHIDQGDMKMKELPVALQIANPEIVAQVERLARAMGLSETAVVERAIDRFARETQDAGGLQRMAVLLAQLDLIPDREDAFDPLPWDGQGLPR